MTALSMPPEIRAIVDAHSAISAAANAARAVSDMPEAKRLLDCEGRRAWRHLEELQRIEAENFADSRGWRVYNGRGWIWADQLAAGKMIHPWHHSEDDRNDVIDHRECFVGWREGVKRTPQACRVPMAILSHTYGSWEPCVEYANRRGLNVERLPWSWYYPGACIAALFTRKNPL